jgi:hypothetical protein
LRGRRRGDPSTCTYEPRLIAAVALVVAVVACGSVACGSSGGAVIVQQGPATDAGYAPSAPMGSCDAVVQQHPIEGFTHVPVCSVVDYGTNPPSSGNHYPIWAAYKIYTSPVPLGFWVHNLEHGAIVFTYNCAVGDGGASDCASEVDAAAQMIAALPADPECVELAEGVTRRSVMTPDPDLDVRFAASAWGWTLKANCFDPTVFQPFALAHYDDGREDLCEDGEDPIAEGIAADCGTE